MFLCRRNILKTPRLENGPLPGITREAVIELAHQSNIKIRETDISQDELCDADEIFQTNSLIEIMPITVINGKGINSGKPGPMTRSLMEAYKNLVKRETII